MLVSMVFIGSIPFPSWHTASSVIVLKAKCSVVLDLENYTDTAAVIATVICVRHQWITNSAVAVPTGAANWRSIPQCHPVDWQWWWVPVHWSRGCSSAVGRSQVQADDELREAFPCSAVLLRWWHDCKGLAFLLRSLITVYSRSFCS